MIDPLPGHFHFKQGRPGGGRSLGYVGGPGKVQGLLSLLEGLAVVLLVAMTNIYICTCMVLFCLYLMMPTLTTDRYAWGILHEQYLPL